MAQMTVALAANLFRPHAACVESDRAGAWRFIIRLLRPSNLVLLIGITLAQPTTAAEFRKSLVRDGNPDLIEVTGDLSSGDEKRFADVAIGSIDAVIVFHSRGGDLVAGIEIGKAIRLKGFSSVVPEDHLCASACALAW